MRKVLLLDYDHTLYPSTLFTLKAVDARITSYIHTHLGFSPERADQIRMDLWNQYGTTLKGLEVHHGVDRDHYCDFIHDIEENFLPPPDAALKAWLGRLSDPVYIFTNARLDWPTKGLKSMGLESFLPSVSSSGIADDQAGETPRLQGIFDIAFMDWQGKPHAQAFAKVDSHLRKKYGEDIRIHFADDRPDNLLAARERRWSTIWVAPENADREPWGQTFDGVVSSLTQLNPDTFT